MSVLRHVRYLKRNTLDLLYKITVRSIIDYALPVYANNLRLTELARLDRIQYRASYWGPSLYKQGKVEY